MKWHRFIFWNLYLVFLVFAIAAETGEVTKASIIKCLLLGSCTVLAILVVDVLVRKWFDTGMQALFFVATGMLAAFTIGLETLLEYLLIGPHPLGLKEKLFEDVVLMAPWIIIAISLFIAEGFNRKQLEQSKAALSYLKHQVNPHFLLNTHNNIYFLIEQNPALASNTLLKLSDIMRYMLYECEAETVSLHKEFKHLENYIELERIRMDNVQVTYHLQYPEEDVEIAPLLLIAFVENAFKHVSRHKDKENSITIEAKMDGGGRLHFSVYNTRATKAEHQDGIGLKNVKQRLNLLYNKRYQLHLEEDEKKYWVKLMIVLK